MSLEQAILEAIRALAADKQQEILCHATRPQNESVKRPPPKNVEGLWADLGISLSAEDIDENRREIWWNFPSNDL